jgi:hypothetical protein
LGGWLHYTPLFYGSTGEDWWGLYGTGGYWFGGVRQSGNGRDVIGLDGCVLARQSRQDVSWRKVRCDEAVKDRCGEVGRRCVAVWQSRNGEDVKGHNR